jgi:large subunit ribosomal protein L21
VYAIVQRGGHQVRVEPGAIVVVDHLADEAGAEVSFDQVLFVAKDDGEMLAGSPFVANARVVAVVDCEVLGPKIRVFMKKRRKGMRKSSGHRTQLTRVRIKEILV